MQISIPQLNSLLADPASRFATLHERNNIQLIRDMTVCSHLVFGDYRYLGRRTNFPNGWAETAAWGRGATDVADLDYFPDDEWDEFCHFSAAGTLVDGNIVYKFNAYMGSDRFSDQISGAATFAPDGTILEFSERNRCNYGEQIGKWWLRCFVGPDAMVHPLMKSYHERELAARTKRLDEWRLEISELRAARGTTPPSERELLVQSWLDDEFGQ